MGRLRQRERDHTGGKKATFSDKEKPKQDKARFSFSKDPGLLTVISPLCPAPSEIRIITSGGAHPPIPLECDRWAQAGAKMRYRGRKPDDRSGVRKVTYGVGRLSVQMGGESYSPAAVTGPADWIETTFIVAGQEYCGRWQDLRKNETDRLVARGPTAESAS